MRACWSFRYSVAAPEGCWSMTAWTSKPTSKRSSRSKCRSLKPRQIGRASCHTYRPCSSAILKMSSVKATPSVDGQLSMRSSPKIACSTSPEAPTVAATRSIGSLARSRRLTLTFGISPLHRQRNWAMAGGSNGYRAAPVKRQSTRGPTSSLPGPDCRRVSLFRQAILNWTTGVVERPQLLSQVPCVKKIGFLSFGHWTPAPYSDVRTASNALLQSIELAVAGEELGLDGAYFRVHPFAPHRGSPFPLLAAVGARTKKIEIGTAVIDMRYENPMYMVEDAGAADIIAGGRLQRGSGPGSPEEGMDGWGSFGCRAAEGCAHA